MRSPMKKLCLLITLTSGVLAVGCELIVDFDRTKIVGEEVAETGPGTTDATTTDSATDSASDSPSEAASDAGNDATDSGSADAADGG